MLKALDAVGRFVLASNAARGEAYYCPGCSDDLIHKCGRVVVPHFAHWPGAECSMSNGESARHMEMKYLCAQLFPDADLEVSCSVERRADVLVGDRFVIECQASPLSIDEWESRTMDYNAMGYPVLWLWDVKRVCGCKFMEAAFSLSENEAWEPRVNAVVRECHQKSYGHLYCADGGQIAACYLARPAARDTYRPYTLRKPVFRDIHPERARAYYGPSGLRLIDFGEGPWWK